MRGDWSVARSFVSGVNHRCYSSVVVMMVKEGIKGSKSGS